MIQRRRFVPFTLEYLELRCLLSSDGSVILQPDLTIAPLSSNSATIQGYTPAQIAEGYGFNQLSDQGSGQTIAIVDAYKDPDIASDLNTFDSKFNLPAPPSFTQINQNGLSISKVQADPGWSLEISLDVEWAHAAAPDANILLVETNTDTLKSLMAGVNYARNAQGVSVVSMSWGGSEFPNETNFDTYFTTPDGHQGVTFLAASGDSGGYYGPEWPSVSPNVVAVGGTSLQLSTGGVYMSESAWSDSSGGYSIFESEPNYQNSAQGSGTRTTPDVALDADPNTGYAVYDSVSYQGYVGWQEIGGTSSATPQWAGIIADADQGRVADGQGTLDGATQTLPLLYSLYASPRSPSYLDYTDDFHDITRGSSSFFTRAGTGYDLVTGLGSPKVSAVVNALANNPVPAAQTTPSFFVSGGKNRHENIFVTPASELSPPAVSFASVADANIADAIQNADATGQFSHTEWSVLTPRAIDQSTHSGLIYSGTVESRVSPFASGASSQAHSEEEDHDAELISARAVGLFGDIWTVAGAEAAHLSHALGVFASQTPSPASVGPWKFLDSASYTKALGAFIGGAILVGVWYADRSRRTKVA